MMMMIAAAEGGQPADDDNLQPRMETLRRIFHHVLHHVQENHRHHGHCRCCVSVWLVVCLALNISGGEAGAGLAA